MKRRALLLLMVAGPLNAQTPQELEGLRHFNQSCRVCHAHSALKAAQYGPALSRITLNGDAQAVRSVIANGTPRMPGFRYHFKPAEIDALAAYLRTVPPPAD